MSAFAARRTGLVAFVLGAALPLLAQERIEVVGPEPAVVRVGEAARCDIHVHNPGGAMRDWEPPKVDGLVIRVIGPQQMQRIIGGRSSFELVYPLELRPEREGTFVVPSFPLWTGTREQQVPELRFEAKKDLRGEELGWVEVTTPATQVYVNEPIRLQVAAGVQQGLRIAVGPTRGGDSYHDVQVSAPWLTGVPGTTPMVAEAPAGPATWMVLQDDRLQRAALDANFQRDGRGWQRFRFEHILLPTSPGTLELAAPTLRYHVVRGTGRDPFGLTRNMSEKLFATGKPLRVEVLPLPEAGRPDPFFGAVGRFALKAELDRDHVRLGSSVKLTLTITGQGNFELLRFPEVDAVPGFHKLGEVEGPRSSTQATKTFDLTPDSLAVTEVPPIAWNWFDTTPGNARYVSTTTQALPLKVTPLPAAETVPSRGTDDEPAAITRGADDVADLPLLSGPPIVDARCSMTWRWLAVGGPWLLAGIVWLALRTWRRRGADPLRTRARLAARQCRVALQRGDEPVSALTTYLGDRLGVPAAALIDDDVAARLRAAGVAEATAVAIAAAITRGTAARYGAGERLDADTVMQLVAQLEPQRFGVARMLPLLLPGLLLHTLLGTASAQTAPRDVEAAVAQYRAGDFAAADSAFARAFEVSGDRRLLRARGNCFSRQQPPDWPRALWAYESARLGSPRDAELLANLRVVRSRLGLPVDDGAPGFVGELSRWRRLLHASEIAFVTAALMALAAVALVFGWRRPAWRWLGVLAGGFGAIGAVELLVLAPARPPMAIALLEVALTSEPRLELAAIAHVRAGASVDVLGSTVGSFVRVRAGDRVGFAPRDAVAVVE